MAPLDCRLAEAALMAGWVVLAKMMNGGENVLLQL